MAGRDFLNANLTAEGLLREIGGLPFLDDEFVPSLLLAAVAAVRRRADEATLPALADYLDPANAGEVFRRHAKSAVQEVACTDLRPVQSQAIEAMRAEIISCAASWEPLFTIPLVYRRMPGDGISCTNVLIPQTIYLGDRAFAPDISLAETLVHEHAHIWLNLITEIFDLQYEGGPADITLPSGTPGKTLRGVLTAAHFAAAAIRFYDRQRHSAIHERRKRYLIEYLDGCLQSSASTIYLAPMGILVWRRLASFLREMT